MSPEDKLPVHVLSGFLGSGKTTLLQRLLAGQNLDDVALLVNEFGEVGIDHLLLGRSHRTPCCCPEDASAARSAAS